MTTTSRSPTRCTSSAAEGPPATTAPRRWGPLVVLALTLATTLVAGCKRDEPTPGAVAPAAAAPSAPAGDDAPQNDTRTPREREIDQILARVHAARAGKPGRFERVAVTPLARGGRELLHLRLVDNGLEVLLVEDHSAPVVSYQTWFRVGSRHDPPGQHGLAHLLEHLMFRRTTGMADGEFDRRMERHGINPSAYTWLDYTYYFQKIPSAQLAEVAAIEADRMVNLHIDQALVDAERLVVLSERHYRVDNDPVGAMLELLYNAAFPGHPYQHQSVGSPRGLARIGVEDCELFYRAWYHPGNAALVLVGDLEIEAALAVVLDAYGALPDKPRRELPHRDAPWPTERSAQVLEMPIEAALLVMGFPAPPLAAPDNAVLDVLDAALFAEPWGLLQRELRSERELVTSLDGWVGDFRFRSLYEISVAMRPGVSHEAARAAILTRLAGLASEPLPPELLERARNHLELAFLERLQDSQGRAEGIGHWWVSADDPAAFFTAIERWRAVDAADIQRLAGELFAPQHLAEVLGRTREHDDDDEPGESAP